jgi:hypothetical protein
VGYADNSATVVLYLTMAHAIQLQQQLAEQLVRVVS